MFLYLILRTHSCSKPENKKDLKELIESFSLYEIINDEDTSIVNVTKKFLGLSSSDSSDEKIFIETL